MRARVLAIGTAALLLAACSSAPTSEPQTCPIPTPVQEPWPANVLDVTIDAGVLVELETFGDGRETVGRWSVAKADVGDVAEEIRAALDRGGFVLEGTPDDVTLAYARASTGQVIEATAGEPDACGQVIVTLSSIAGDVPDPRPAS